MLIIVVIRQPAAAAGALLCTWALDQWARSQSSYFVANMGLTNWITSFLLLGALLLRYIKGKSVFRPLTREYFAEVAIYSLAVLSWLWSVSPDDTYTQLMGQYRTIAIFGFLMPLAVSDLKDLRASLYTVMVVGFTIALVVLATGDFQGRQLMFKTGGVFAEEGLTAGNPLAIAGSAAYVAIIGMLMNFRGAARIWQVMRYAIIGVAFALSVKSGSRGQTLSILVVTLCFLPYSRRFKDLRSFLTVAISLALFGAVTLFLLSLLTADQTSAGERWSYDAFADDYVGGRVGTSMKLLAFWANSDLLHWVIGLGSSAAFRSDIVGFYPHLVLAEVLGELGIVGWAILWLFPIFLILNLRELWTYVQDDAEDRGLVAALGALAVFEIMMSFKQGNLLSSHIGFAFIIISGRLAVTCRQQAAEYAALDAGMYAMTPDDWEDVGDYDAPLAGGATIARQ